MEVKITSIQQTRPSLTFDKTFIINTTKSLIGIGIRTISIISHFHRSKELEIAKEHFLILGDISSVHSGITSAFTLINNLQKQNIKGSHLFENILDSISAIIGIAISTLRGIGFLDRLKIFNLATISMSFGTASNIGQTALKILSLSNVGSVFSIIQSTIGIGINCIKFYNQNKKIDAAKEKIKTWKQPVTLDVTQKKIQLLTIKFNKLNAKTEDSLQELGLENEKLIHTIENFQNEKKNFQNTKGVIRAFKWIKLKYLKFEKDHIKKIHQSKILELTDHYDRIDQTSKKLKSWENIKDNWDHLNAQDFARLDQFCRDKVSKWKSKIKNFKAEQLHNIIHFGLKVVLLAASVAALVLSMTGFGIIPVAATLAAITLAFMIGSLGYSIYLRFLYKKISTEPVAIPSM